MGERLLYMRPDLKGLTMNEPNGEHIQALLSLTGDMKCSNGPEMKWRHPQTGHTEQKIDMVRFWRFYRQYRTLLGKGPPGLR